MLNTLNFFHHYFEFVPLTIIVFIIPLVLTSCSSSGEYIPEKMDTSLNQRISSLEKNNPKESIQFLGKTSDVISEDIKTELESTGIVIESTVQNIFTAKGRAADIKKLTMFDFVIFLELTQKLDIK